MKRFFLNACRFFCLLCFLAVLSPHLNARAVSCYSVTPDIHQAVLTYLDEIYVRKYPDMALEFCHGSIQDKTVLQKLADTITGGLSSEKEKANAISRWVARNIQYQSVQFGTFAFPMDVFYERKGNCLGYAQLIQHLLRLEGIPAVAGYGYRGDMKLLDTDSIDDMMGHAWVYARLNGSWYLYDPLFSVECCSDREQIARWYYPNNIEGISPYYPGMDTKLMYGGNAIYYVDGRFINYYDGLPASQAIEGGAEGGKSINNTIAYFAKNRYLDSDGIHDGWVYLENNDLRQPQMVNDECYSDGWISYAGNLAFARPNGILTSNTIRRFGNSLYFFSYDGTALKFADPDRDYFLTCGYPTIKPGEQIQLLPGFLQSELEKGRVLEWSTSTPDLVSVNSDGVITGKSAGGLATVQVETKDAYHDDSHYMWAGVQVYVSDTPKRAADYTDRGPNDDGTDPDVPSNPSGGGSSADDGSTPDNGNSSPGSNTPNNGNSSSSGNTKKKQTIKASSKTVAYKSKPFYLKAKAKGKLTYKSSNRKVAVVSRTGRVTVKAYGKATITIKAAATKSYQSAVKKITVKVVPKKASFSKVYSPSKKTISVRWRKNSTATGYQVSIARNKTFTKSRITKTLSRSKTSLTLKNRKSKATYYVRVRSYKKVGSAKYYGPWSSIKKVRVR